MSKMDGLRAMREARYAEAAARAAQAKPNAKKAAPVAPPAPKKSAPATSEPGADDGLCGHRSMNGRTCTREHGHAAKSHRYG
jgi:hypothetical protein